MEGLSEIQFINQEAVQSSKNTVCAPRYLPPSKWDKYFDWPPPGGLRHIIFHAETNGFSSAIKRVGRSVLIDVPMFWKIVERSK